MRSLTFLAIVLVIMVVVVALRPRAARAALLKEGDSAPAFKTQMVVGDQTQPVALSDFKGKRVVLYFYPKDNTPGCTKEACAFRDGFDKLSAAGLVVLGCSVDSEDSHKDFIKKYHLPFPLLLDPDKKIASAYGVVNGIPILGLDKRVTYVIDGNGRIIKVYPRVDPSANATQILSDIPAQSPAAAVPAAAPADNPANSE